jgi:hypothetical protein
VIETKAERLGDGEAHVPCLVNGGRAVDAKHHAQAPRLGCVA